MKSLNRNARFPPIGDMPNAFVDPMMRVRLLACVTMAAALGACNSVDSESTADIRHYTGVSLCNTAVMRDLTSPQDRNGVVGFSFHVAFQLSPSCDASFRSQLAALPQSNCSASGDLSHGCFVEDAYGKSGKHTSIAVTALGRGRYEMQFWS